MSKYTNGSPVSWGQLWKVIGASGAIGLVVLGLHAQSTHGEAVTEKEYHQFELRVMERFDRVESTQAEYRNDIKKILEKLK